jgi:hypothetical protein
VAGTQSVFKHGDDPALPTWVSSPKKVALKVQYPDLPRSGIRPARPRSQQDILEERDAGGLRPFAGRLALAEGRACRCPLKDDRKARDRLVFGARIARIER